MDDRRGFKKVIPGMIVPTVSASLFHWEKNQGTADVSDLPEEFYGRVWQDSCDLGFVVKSPKTGVEKTFILDESQTRRGEDGLVSLTFKEYRPLKHSAQLQITVYND